MSRNKKNTVVVTGGAGFIGSNLIKFLIEKTNKNIISIDDYSSGTKKNHVKNPRVKYIVDNTINIKKRLSKIIHSIDVIFHSGTDGETYNIGGFNEWKNIDLVHLLCDIMDDKLDRDKGESRKLITFVKDRAGHDLRYAIDATKIKTELGWEPSLQFEEGLEKTVDWYLANEKWLNDITSGDYQNYYEEHYQ